MNKLELKQLVREAVMEALSNPKPVVGRYIYFTDSKELYSLKPYKLIGKQCDISLANSWKKTTVMQGEDVRDIIGGEIGMKVKDTAAWYEVNNSAPKDHTFTVYIGI